MIVTLIRLPLVAPKGSLNNEPTPPIGLAYLASSLREAGFEVHGIDATAQDLNRIVKLADKALQYNGIDVADVIAQIDPETRVIGITCMFSHEWTFVRDAIAEIGAARPGVTIIVGGEHATALAEYTLRDCPAIGFVGLGEGEGTIVAFCRAIEDGEDPRALEGLAYLDDEGAFMTTPARARIRDVGSIPWPDWHAFPIEPYLDNAISFGASLGRNMPIMATRGCPYQCTFCSNPLMWTTRYAMRPPEDVVAEIKTYIERYHITGLQFYDLTAIIKKKWIMEFCDRVIDEGIEIDWSLPSGTRSEALDDEALARLAKANLKYLVYAPESGSPRTLELIKKKIKPERMFASIRSAIRQGITVRTNLIIGFPHETRSDIWLTLKSVLRYAVMGVEEVPVYPFQPYPGTELFQYLIEKGRVRLNDQYFDSLATLSTGKLTPPDDSYCESAGRLELYAYRLFALIASYGLSYLLHPGRIVRTVKSLSSDRSTTVLEQRLKDQYRKFRVSKVSRDADTA